MKKCQWEFTKNKILEAEVPRNTKTYTAIPHRVFLEEVTAEINASGYTIISEEYMGASGYKILTGSFLVNKTGEERESEIAPSIYFVNSYNKVRRAILHAGAKVLVCKNGMMGTVGEGRFSRKHSGNALQELREHIKVVVNNLNYEFDRLVKNKEEMKAIQLNKSAVGSLVGDMIINEQLITNTQLDLIRHELKFSKSFTDASLWSFYNHCTQAFKESHPANYDIQHIKLHTYLSDKFQLTGSRGLYGGPLEGIEDLAIIAQDED